MRDDVCTYCGRTGHRASHCPYRKARESRSRSALAARPARGVPAPGCAPRTARPGPALAHYLALASPPQPSTPNPTEGEQVMHSENDILNPRFLSIESQSRTGTMAEVLQCASMNFQRYALSDVVSGLNTEVARVLGSDAMFEMVGQLDPRPDLMHPSVTKTAVGFARLHGGADPIVHYRVLTPPTISLNIYVHAVPRWPGYYLAAVTKLVHDELTMQSYIVRLVKRG